MEVQIFHMATKTIKFVSLILVVLFLGSCAKNNENTVFVETENGKRVPLKNFYFGLKKTVKTGTIVKKEKTSDGKDIHQISGGKFIFYIQNEIQFKPGTAFGATWHVPQLDENDKIILNIQLEISTPTKNGMKGSEILSINKIITSEIKGSDYFHLELESGDALGNYKFGIFNKGKLVASNIFHIKK